MLKVNCARWGQSKELLREEALKVEHPRTRERLMALYEISEGKNATQVGKETKRNSQTVMKWVHRYNKEGLEALKYQRTGGRKPVLSAIVEEELGKQIRNALALAAVAPQERKTKPIPRWTLKRFVQWLQDQWKINCCRETVRRSLKQLGFSCQKAKKFLNKGNTAKRAEFVEKITGLLNDAMYQKRLLIYIDEAHIHLDTDEGYGWSIKGERFWVSSSSPGRKKVSFYGVYIYNQAQTRIFPYEKAEKLNTIDVLKKIQVEFPEQKITIVWDGAPYHRAALVKEAASDMGIHLEPLPGYSPDFMPVEHLWQWLREDVTYHTCYESQKELIDAVADFQHQINNTPIAVSAPRSGSLRDRLWVKKHLDPEEEKLRFSK